VSLRHVEQLAVHYEPEPGRRVRVGRLAIRRGEREVLFEYDAAFVLAGLELSPIKLPLQRGVLVGPASPFDGLFGVFDDSLPDGWGRLLIDRRAAEAGLAATALTPLDRLAIVGARSMGALLYEPETPLDEPSIVRLADLAAETEKVIAGTRGADLERLIALGGSPKGARPKVLIQIAPNDDVHFGAREILPGFTAWLVKFPAPGDDRHAGPLEHAYCLMARAAGIEVPRTQLLCRTRRHPGYFASERFDRAGARRIHAHTLGGLLHLPHGYAALDYVDVLVTTRRLTRDERSVVEMFRRACFNVLAHNRDDHTRNFAFLMEPTGEWRPSPAYDLTVTGGPGGEHTILVAGEGRAPGLAHLMTVADRAGIKRRTASRALDEVRAAIARFASFADQAGVPARLRASVARVIGARAAPSASSRRDRRPRR
jgi:serine/threonine-protein kinase HipA